VLDEDALAAGIALYAALALAFLAAAPPESHETGGSASPV
jgi:hypothetical protein